jgi:uncharacterized protein YceH (UPF0502 family)
LSGEVVADSADSQDATAPVTRQSGDDRMAALEQMVAELRSEVGDMRQQLQDFRKQFE